MYLIRDRQYNQCYTPLAFFLRRYPQCSVNTTQFFHRAFPRRSSCATWAASPFAQHGILTTTKQQIKALTETAEGCGFCGACAAVLVGFKGQLGRGSWLVGPPDMNQETENDQSNQKELVKQEVRCHDNAPFTVMKGDYFIAFTLEFSVR
jgi:hypothetical protein